jgi:two-component system, LytTR family, response regulator
MTIRTLIVDDEPLAREGMRLHLEPFEDIEVVGEGEDGPSAIDAIRTLRPDLVFLDIQMPGVDGFGVIEALAEDELPEIVFVTAFDQHALQAFEAHALDYLLKPLDEERIDLTIRRVRRRFSTPDPRLHDQIGELLQHVRNRERFLERIVVRSAGRYVLLRTADIDWIEAASNYAQLHIGSRVYSLRETMNGLESKLDPDAFIRVHRSVIVRIDRIRELEPLVQGDYVVVLKDGTKITSSRSYRERIRELLDYDRR